MIRNKYKYCTFAPSIMKQFVLLFVNRAKLDFTSFKIIYLSGLHSCSTLGGFSLLKGFYYGV